MTMLPARRNGRTLTVADPSAELEDIYDRMGQLVNAAFGDLGLGRAADMAWSPPADLTETDTAYEVHVEVPGVSKDQLSVQADDREVVITGEIKDEPEGRRKRHRSSRRTGAFEYRAVLPGDVKADQVTAELSHGVLTVTLPKPEQAKPSQVEVTTS
jgi:HSP20 family protein